MRHGKGLQQYTNGTVLDGYFLENRFIKGRMIFEDSKLTGQYTAQADDEALLNGGDFTLNLPNLEYSGQFKDGKICGTGILKWAAASGEQLQFKGQFDELGFATGQLEVKGSDGKVSKWVEGAFNTPFQNVINDPSAAQA